MKKQVYWFNNLGIRIALHVLFIAFSFYILLHVFKAGSTPERVDFIYTALFLATVLPAVYGNLVICLPRLARNAKWHWYIISVLALIFLFTWLHISFFESWSARLFPQYFFISYYTWWEIGLFIAAFIAITSLLKLSKSWFVVTDLNNKLLESEKQKVQIELKALKAQINPHFFFNTLNSIYSMALDKDQRLPGTVLQLSDLMRYFLYESKEDLVPLKKELQVLRDYMALQKIRSNEKLKVEVNITGEAGQQKIAPLLLITFLENAFKHGAKGSTGEAFIRMNMEVKEHRLAFVLENNKGVIDHVENGENRGMGLENVKRRLELIYPGKHDLRVEHIGDLFIVHLQLPL